MAKQREPTDPAAMRVTPVTVTQMTSAQVLGIDHRRFLALLADHPELPRVALGKLRVVRVDDFLALLARLATSGDSAPPKESRPERQPETEDEVLAELGYRRRRTPTR